MFHKILLLLCIIAITGADKYVYEGDTPQDGEILYNIGNLTATSDCRRECRHGERPRICYFEFNVEHYSAMGVACAGCATGTFEDCFNPQCVTADGLERGITVVNRQMPGPSIQVCKNDMIIVDVNNLMHGMMLTIHWHGLLQRGTQFMDGVPGVSQCAIPQDTSFRYIFSTPDAGTYFWHAHSGLIRSSGVYGPLIVRQPSEGNPHSSLYTNDEYDHVMQLADWMPETPEMFMPGLPTRPPGYLPTNFLMNGRGRAITDAAANVRTPVPYEVFRVRAGETYRFRIINAGYFICPIQLQIDQHNMVIIETDGSDCIATQCDTLVTYSGERYSFVLTANQAPGLYWIRIRGIGLCQQISPREQFAILAYEEAIPEETVPRQQMLPPTPEPDIADTWEPVIIANPMNCESSPTSICITDFRSIFADQEVLAGKVDLRFHLHFGLYRPDILEFFRRGRYEHFVDLFHDVNLAYINSISNVLPATPLLTQWLDSSVRDTCSVNKLPQECSGEAVCLCTHVIKVFQNAIVEIILSANETAQLVTHPFHLHGNSFYVMSKGEIPATPPVTLDNVPFRFAPFKDSVNVDAGGYIVLRFRADNPGLWYFHCHLDYHVAAGMAVIFQVGEPKHHPPLPVGFPTCGNFLPTIRKKDDGY